MASAPPALRAYQRAMLEQGRRAPLRAHRAALLFQLATGGGKTRIGLEVGLGHNALAPTNRTLWLAHRDELVQQPIDKLREYGVEAAAIRPGAPPVGDARFVVASVQTILARGLDILPRCTLVIPDEARHYCSGEQWSEIALAIATGRHVVGLDATPKGDLTPLFAHCIPGPSVADLTAAGYLAPAIHIGPTEERDTLADLPVPAYLRHVAPHRAIVFCRDVAHANHTTAQFKAAGIRAACVEGKTGTRDRRASLDAYGRGEIDVLVNVFCLTEGFDSPATVGIMVWRKVGDEETWIQMGGRGLRTYPGKDRCKIVDPYGLTWRLGLMEEARPWGIEGRGLPSRSALPPCVTCPNCLALSPPSRICPGCGRMAPPRPPPKVSKAEMKAIRQDRLARTGTDWDRWCRLVWEGRAKGWKPQAAGWIFMQEFGRPPKWRQDHVPPPPEGWTVPGPRRGQIGGQKETRA